MKNYIKGQYKRSLFESSNGYVIGLCKIIETNDPELEDYIDEVMTFTGYFAELNEQDTYLFYGELIEHPKYGLQYQVASSEKILPNDKDGIIQFLSSSLFKGVGIKLATKIVETLGEKTLELILENKDNLKKVPKLSRKKIEEIYHTLDKYEESHKIVVYLTELGFNMRDSLSIYHFYKENTMMMVKEDIYQLIDDIEELNFLKIDEIAKKLEYDLLNNKRIQASIMYIFKHITFKNGDTYLLYEDLKKHTFKYLNHTIEDESFIFLLDDLRFQNKLVLEEDRYYLRETYNDEESISQHIHYLLNQPKNPIKDFEKYVKTIQKEFNIIYSGKQKESIKKALENNVLIITGGPGTGKTTIIKAIVAIYQLIYDYTIKEVGTHLALLAPTGRASKRMQEATTFPATTIHRYLKWNKEANSFSVNEFNPNKEELIIIDEVSMIDTNLLANLFRGITKQAKIIFVGDYHQLPSVGPGQILKDFIESNVIDLVELDLLYRQGEDSYISKLAHDIKNTEPLEDLDTEKQDFTFLTCSKEMIVESVKTIAKQIVDKGYHYKQFQILAPMYAGINGIDNLNKELQHIFNPKDPHKNELKNGNVIYRENDKILQLVNIAESNVFNGDIGIIKQIIPATKSESKKNEIYIDYDGIEVKYLPKDFIYIKHGYVISIHKSQGSEFDIVLMPVCRSYHKMLYKKLLYTGITRAKNKLILLGEKEAFLYGIHNQSELLRKTTLKNKLDV